MFTTVQGGEDVPFPGSHPLSKQKCGLTRLSKPCDSVGKPLNTFNGQSDCLLS